MNPSLVLPAGAVTATKLPDIACYITNTGTAWLPVTNTPASSTSGQTYCGLAQASTTSQWQVVMVNPIAGWQYQIIASW